MATDPHPTLVTKSNVGLPSCLRGFCDLTRAWASVCFSSLSANYLCCFCVAAGVRLVTLTCRPLFCDLLHFVIYFLPVGERFTTRHENGRWLHPSTFPLCIYIYVCIPTTYGVELSTGHTVSPRFWTTETRFSTGFWPGKTRFYVCFWCFRIFEKHPFAVLAKHHMDWS